MKLSDRTDRGRRPGGWGRLIWYVILLIVILILMWQMEPIVRRLPF